MVRAPTLRDRVEYVGARVMEVAVRALPPPLADRFGAAIGRLAGGRIGIRRNVVEDNLAHAFPDRDAAWRRRVGLASYEHLGREAVAMLRLADAEPDEIVRRTHIEGWDDLLAALEAGRGAIVVSGHLGNWEISAAASAARGVEIEAVVRRQRNKLFDAHLERTRQRLGIHTIGMRDAPRRIPRALREGRLIGIVGDQDAGRAGVWVPFFGRAASTFRGPALFALRLGAPLFAASVLRRGDHYDIRLDRIEIEPTGDLERDVGALTAALARHLESAVRAAPEQYFWVHKRWKTRPDPEPAAGAPGSNKAMDRARSGEAAARRELETDR